MNLKNVSEVVFLKIVANEGNDKLYFIPTPHCLRLQYKPAGDDPGRVSLIVLLKHYICRINAVPRAEIVLKKKREEKENTQLLVHPVLLCDMRELRVCMAYACYDLT
jgi:hypothetical protein